MDRRGTVGFKGSEMSGCRVAHVAIEAVLRIDGMQRQHARISHGLGEDGGGGNGGNLAIALDHGFDGYRQFRTAVAIDHRLLRRQAQSSDRTLHGEKGGMQDIELIDFLDAGFSNCPGQCLFADFSGQHLAPLFGKLLGVVQAGEVPFRLLFGHAQDALGAADVSLVASGTATLEAALIKRPMVITYRLAKLSWWIMKRMAYLPYVGLPNVLAGRFVVPELLQNDATPDKLAEALVKLYEDKENAAAVAETFTEIHHRLRQNNAEKAARAVIECLN